MTFVFVWMRPFKKNLPLKFDATGYLYLRENTLPKSWFLTKYIKLFFHSLIFVFHFHSVAFSDYLWTDMYSQTLFCWIPSFSVNLLMLYFPFSQMTVQFHQRKTIRDFHIDPNWTVLYSTGRSYYLYEAWLVMLTC